MRERGIGSVRPPSRGSELTIDTQAASERRETDASLAERTVREALAKARWREMDLATQPKGHHAKVNIAQQLRTQTPMSRQWIAGGLRMGSASLRERVYVNRAPTTPPPASDSKIDGLRRGGIPGQERLALDKQGGKTI
jgi:hypothetical protein